jgi:NAD(P)-dependent dehydrogenase (short-subunit alcohol dehydrogenase family)
MSSQNSQKIAIVTGASRGIGRNTALNLAKQGVDVIFTYQSKLADAESLIQEFETMGQKAVAFQLDIGNSKQFDEFVSQVQQALKTWGKSGFDYLVNNAGNALYEPITSMTEVQFDDIFNIHIKGPYFLTQKLLPLMNDDGRIVNISSGLTRFSSPGSSAYASAKGALEVFTRYLAKEFGSRGITANIIAPGAIETDFGGGHVRNSPELKKMISDNTALGRPGLADDVGPVIASLLSPETRWVNGQRIEVSGGMAL